MTDNQTIYVTFWKGSDDGGVLSSHTTLQAAVDAVHSHEAQYYLDSDRSGGVDGGFDPKGWKASDEGLVNCSDRNIDWIIVETTVQE